MGKAAKANNQTVHGEYRTPRCDYLTVQLACDGDKHALLEKYAESSGVLRYLPRLRQLVLLSDTRQIAAVHANPAGLSVSVGGKSMRGDTGLHQLWAAALERLAHLWPAKVTLPRVDWAIQVHPLGWDPPAHSDLRALAAHAVKVAEKAQRRFHAVALLLPKLLELGFSLETRYEGHAGLPGDTYVFTKAIYDRVNSTCLRHWWRVLVYDAYDPLGVSYQRIEVQAHYGSRLLDSIHALLGLDTQTAAVLGACVPGSRLPEVEVLLGWQDASPEVSLKAGIARAMGALLACEEHGLRHGLSVEDGIKRLCELAGLLEVDINEKLKERLGVYLSKRDALRALRALRDGRQEAGQGAEDLTARGGLTGMLRGYGLADGEVTAAGVELSDAEAGQVAQVLPFPAVQGSPCDGGI